MPPDNSLERSRHTAPRRSWPLDGMMILNSCRGQYTMDSLRAVLVTAYRPDPARWSEDFLRRKE
jgi:hypothetical protein